MTTPTPRHLPVPATGFPQPARRWSWRTRVARSALLAVPCLALLLAGCATQAPERFYTLQTQTPATSATQMLPVQLVLAGLNVPELVDKPQLVIRKNAQQVQILEQQRWAEPLKRGLTQALAANLRAQGLQVSLRSEYPATDNAWLLWIDVLQFESVPGKEALLEVQWQVRNRQGVQAFAASGLWHEPVSGADIEAVVAAHQRALVQCAQEIKRSLQRLPTGATADSAASAATASPPATASGQP